MKRIFQNSEHKELANYGMMIWDNVNFNFRKAVAGYKDSGESDFGWISYKSVG